MQRLIGAVKGMHPYEVPEIVFTEVIDGNPSYIKWVIENTFEINDNAERDAKSIAK
jgi:uncharacterized protein involved in tolerance to divalent cations